MSADIRQLLLEMVERGASDLYITVDSPPMVRVEGINYPVEGDPLTPTEVEALANSLKESARSMTGRYKESSIGGVAVNVVEC